MQISPPTFTFLTVKSRSVTQRSVSQENAFKKNKNPSAFLLKAIGSNNSFNMFTLMKKKIRIFKIAKFELKVTVHYGLWAEFTHL